MEKIRIAIFTDTFTPATNGVVTATLLLVKGLADKGHKVFLVSPYFRDAAEFDYPQVTHIRCRGLKAFFHNEFRTTLPLNLALLRKLKMFKPHIIHFQTPWTIGLQGLFTSKILKRPLVGTFHTYISDPDYLKNIRLKSRYISQFADRYCFFYYSKCNLVTAPARATVSFLLKQGKLKVPVSYISNGIDGSIFNNMEADQLRQQYAGKNSTLFLYVGRIAPEKNISFLLQAFHKAVERDRNCKLLIIGDGRDYEKVNAYIHQNGLGESIFLVGKIPHEQLVKSGYFGACDVFITASKTENQPMTVLEAQQNGLPCICLDAKGMPDLVIHGKNGLLSPVDDVSALTDNILRAHMDKGLLSQLRMNTLKIIKNHDIDYVIQRWEEYYLETIKNYSMEMVS